MKKIIFFENKVDRKNSYNIDFSKHREFLNTVFGNDACNKELDAFLKDNTILDQYDTVLMHATIYHEDKRNKLFRTLKEYCKNKINLVIFSGGGDIGSLNNNILEVTAKSFYENINIFLNKYQDATSNLLMLAYGENWDLNMLLNTLEKLNVFIANNDEIIEDFDDFEDDFNFIKIKKVLAPAEYKLIFKNVKIDDYEINTDQIKIIRDNLKNLIQDRANG